MPLPGLFDFMFTFICFFPITSSSFWILQFRDDDKDPGFNFEYDSWFRMAVWVSSNDFINSHLANSSFWRKLKFSFMFSQDYQGKPLEAPLISDSIFLFLSESSHLTWLFHAERSTSTLDTFDSISCVYSVLLFSISVWFFSFIFKCSQVSRYFGNSALKTMPILMDWGEYNCIFQVTLDLSIKCLILLGVINMIVLYCIYTRL